jgi:hypothetical protein
MINVTMTDTFGGELNYSWVERRTIEIDDYISDRALIRQVKKALGVSHVKHVKIIDTFDFLRIDLIGTNVAITMESSN